MLTIIHAKPEHIPAIAALERASFSQPWSENSIRGEMENPCAQIWVALRDEMLVGYIGTQKIAGECYITNLAVEKDAQKQGIGTALLDKAQEDAERQNCVFITLEVRESNAAARRLYEKHGFRTAGRRKNYYEDPREDGLILTKFLREGIGKS